MSDRSTRESTTREATERPKVWKPANVLTAELPADGKVRRWIRAKSRNEFDDSNWTTKELEHWTPVAPSEVPSLVGRRSGDVIERGGLILCENDAEIVRQRNAHWQERIDTQAASAQSEIAAKAHRSMPLLRPEIETETKVIKN